MAERRNDRRHGRHQCEPDELVDPIYFVAFNSDAYFLAYSPTGLGGKEIWKIADDAPPARLRAPAGYLNSVEQLLPVGNQLFFTRFSDELWTTDGTEAGTRLVKTVRYGGVGLATSLTECNGILYFVATTNQHGGSSGAATERKQELMARR